MRNLLACILLACAIAATAVRPATRMTSFSRTQLASATTSTRMVSAHVTIDDAQALSRLRDIGVTINTVTGRIATIQLPASSIALLARLDGVRSVGLAKRLTLANDTARILSHIDAVHEGVVAQRQFTGKGTLIGIIDTGVDFNHINLCDDNGNSRVVAAYLPSDSTGISPEIDGNTLPGSHYNTPEQIAQLTADCSNISHGTHTSGTAAGSCRANGWYGVAPDAQLVICSMPETELTDVNIANSVRYIFDVATRLNLPCVINISLASESGPHDGTGLLPELFDQLSGPGRICVLSAANSGMRAHTIDHTFTSETDTVYTAIANYRGHSGWTPGELSVWSSSSEPHSVAFTVVSKSSGKILCSWEIPQVIEQEEGFTIDAETDPNFNTYFSEGNIIVANGVQDCNGHFNTYATFEVKPIDADHRLGVKLSSHKGDRMCVWGGGDVVLTRDNHSYMTSGKTSMSISDLACGDSTISVGAYCSRKYMPLADGSVSENSRAVVGDLAYYSSYGPDARGIARPDVTAPGFSLVSSVSRYDTVSSQITALQAPGLKFNETFFPYSSYSGTSMSAPVVTGAVALCLQVNPKLGPAKVRQLIKDTSVRDSYVESARSKWGAGKLNVEALITQLLRESAIDDVVTQAISVTPGCCNGDFSINGIIDDGARVAVIDLQGRVVATRVLHGSNQLSLSNVLDDGIYIVAVDTQRQHHTAKIIVKH